VVCKGGEFLGHRGWGRLVEGRPFKAAGWR
jgi:hypothetical protein